jgi:hypothetical protein
MKFIPCTLGVVLGLAPLAWSQKAGQMRDAATHDELTMAHRRAAQQDPMRDMQPAKGEDPSVANQPKDILSRSEIICFNGTAALVPKRAILHVPAAMQGRLKFLPGSTLVTWKEFLTLHRGWISTVEVSRQQAEGNEALKEEISTRISKSSNLVVATYMGGPISVLPLKVPAETETSQTETTP